MAGRLAYLDVGLAVGTVCLNFFSRLSYLFSFSFSLDNGKSRRGEFDID